MVLAAWRGRGYRSPLPPGLGGCLPGRGSVESGVEAGVQPSLRVTLTAGRGGPRAPHCCVHQSSDRDSAPSRVPLRAVGPIPRKASGSKVPEPTPPPGSDHGDFRTFPVTSWPQAASLRSLAFLAPYTCHLFHPGLIALPRDRFFHLSLFGPGQTVLLLGKTEKGVTSGRGSGTFPNAPSAAVTPCPQHPHPETAGFSRSRSQTRRFPPSPQPHCSSERVWFNFHGFRDRSGKERASGRLSRWKDVVGSMAEMGFSWDPLWGSLRTWREGWFEAGGASLWTPGFTASSLSLSERLLHTAGGGWGVRPEDTGRDRLNASSRGSGGRKSEIQVRQAPPPSTGSGEGPPCLFSPLVVSSIPGSLGLWLHPPSRCLLFTWPPPHVRDLPSGLPLKASGLASAALGTTPAAAALILCLRRAPCHPHPSPADENSGDKDDDLKRRVGHPGHMPASGIHCGLQVRPVLCPWQPDPGGLSWERDRPWGQSEFLEGASLALGVLAQPSARLAHPHMTAVILRVHREGPFFCSRISHTVTLRHRGSLSDHLPARAKGGRLPCSSVFLALLAGHTGPIRLDEEAVEEGFRTAWKQQAFSGLRFTEANFLCRRGMKRMWHSCPREQEPRGASWPLMEKLPETPLALMLYLRLRAVKKENECPVHAQRKEWVPAGIVPGPMASV
ncbi:hypothetical protein J1605_010033 [Eschrichtius robustus]|uniref:Uncharacterized protein n=1 Tax=Eschrichtius robustus TaxID=9764 RepID=A0AB34GVR1_ESCRO|nr:hypothetical protein J1605_010033 [Eschrichtius robustus]